MKKKMLVMLVTLFLLTGGLSLAAGAEGAYVRPAPVYSATVTDSVIGIPVKVTTYVLDRSAKNHETIVYVKGTMVERIGQESDDSIIDSYIQEGYLVVILDYQNNAKACVPQLEYSVYDFRTQMVNSYTTTKYYAGVSVKKYQNFMLPAGYRLERNINFFNLLENGSKGTAEYILNCWNNDANFKKNYGSSIPACAGNNYQGGWFQATSLDQLVRRDGQPISFDLGLHIIYPSNPTKQTPVFIHASSWEEREGSSCGTAGLVDHGLVFRGFSVAYYDHDYIPMSRQDHYGYFGAPYGTSAFNGVKAHTAAIRCIKYYAEEFGYKIDSLAVWGVSKSSYCSVVGQTNPEAMTELSVFTGFPNETYGPQPYLTDRHGNPLSGNVQAVYTAMGDGTKQHKKIVNNTTVPTVICCGRFDEFGCWDYWPDTQATYKKFDIPTLAITMNDLGHDNPRGIDPDLNYDRAEAVVNFMNYQLNGGAPMLVYTSPVDGSETYDGKTAVVLKFNAPMKDVETSVVIREKATGKALSGFWTVTYGQTEYAFSSDGYETGEEYEIVIPATLKSTDGRTIDTGETRTFTAKITGKLFPAADATVELGNRTVLGQAATLELANGTKRVYLTFDLTEVNLTALTEAGLNFHVENEAAQTVSVYALSDTAPAWNEETLTWDNAPANTAGNTLDSSLVTLLGKINVAGSGTYELDLLETVENYFGKELRLVLVAEKAAGQNTVLSLDADSKTSLVRCTASNTNYTGAYDYKLGGAAPTPTLTSAVDHTTGSGKSIQMTRTQTYNRVKFYNTFGTSELTEADVGRNFHISFYANPEADMTVTGGIMASYNDDATTKSMWYYPYDTNFYGTTASVSCKAGVWTEVAFDVTITKEHLEGKILMLTISADTVKTFCVDDIRVTETATDVTLTSNEGHDFVAGKIRPCLALDGTDISMFVATMGPTGYTSLADAIAAVPSDKSAAVITLKKDTTLDSLWTVSANQNVVLDLGGHTLTVNHKNANTIKINGILRIKNGTFVDGLASRAYTFRVMGEGSVLEFLPGLTVDSKADAGIAQVGIDDNSLTAAQGIFLSHDGVTVKSVFNAFYLYQNGEVNIDGGLYDDTAYARLFTLKPKVAAVPALTRVISGGVFTSLLSNTQYSAIGNITGLTVSGGTYAVTIPAANLPEGKICQKNADGSYTVKSAPVTVNGVGYATFAEAIAAIPKDGTKTLVKLHENMTLSDKLTVEETQNVVLDLGGNTITSTSNKNPRVVTVGSLLIQNGTFVDHVKEPLNSGYTFGVYGNEKSYLEFGKNFTLDSKVDAGGVLVGSADGTQKGFFRSGKTVTMYHAYNAFYIAELGSIDITGGYYEDTVDTRIFKTKNATDASVVRTISGGTFLAKTSAPNNLISGVGGIVFTGGTFPVTLPSGAILGSGRSDVTISMTASVLGTYSDVKMRFTRKGNAQTVAGKKAGTEYTFDYLGLPPQCLGDTLKVELLGDGNVLQTIEKYSPLSYLESLLHIYAGDEKLRTVASDLIVYGAAAQAFTGYESDKPITDFFEENANFTPSTGIVPDFDSDFSLTASTNANVKLLSANVEFSNVNRLFFKFTTDAPARTTVKIDGVTVTPVSLGNGVYSAYSEELCATDFDKKISVTLEVDGVAVQNLTYSINYYTSRKQNSSNFAMAELAKATYRYGASAEIITKGAEG